MKLSDPISEVPFVGTGYTRTLSRLEIESIKDLLWHIPQRYIDVARRVSIAQAHPEELLTIVGTILSVSTAKTRRGLWLTKALINDGTGTLSAIWFNQPFLKSTLKSGSTVALAGKVTLNQGNLVMQVPDYELGERFIHTGRLVPIYGETAGISSKWIRSRVHWILSHISISDWMSDPVRLRYELVPLSEAFQEVHFPKDDMHLSLAVRRLGVEELLVSSIRSLKLREVWEHNTGAPVITVDQYRDKVAGLIHSLPFTLTTSQKQALEHIFSDLRKSRPMNRLLQGDVGSGKTVVATIALYLTTLSGFDAVLMAPTEILAHQHAQSIGQMLLPFGVPVRLVTGSVRKVITDTKPSIYVGTHALLGPKLAHVRAGLIVIDEQHRFGVAQRSVLRVKTGNPHTLTMTATPIPRSITLTLYGNLDLSFMELLPSGRKQVKTYVVPSIKRDSAYAFIRKQLAAGRQAFIICPFIDPSDTMQSIKAASLEHRKAESTFSPYTCGLLHGKMSTKLKYATLDAFSQGACKVLVATPVVEVGIDVPNASVIIIEAADRFGLAQLHQLRGRVGRGSHESYCLLFTESTHPLVSRRLATLAKTHLGSQVANLDLSLRGPGELYGLRQHGQIRFKAADLGNTELVKMVHDLAHSILHEPTILAHPNFPVDLSVPTDPN